jgi:hypothetical protein
MAPGFKPITYNPSKVKNRFQDFAFQSQRAPLRRGAVMAAARALLATGPLW